jgi:hypothetical protein
MKRPASEFPETADLYVCDECGRDITVHLHRGRAHVRQPLGPVRYVCRCGQSYLSGATEWDYLSDWEKQQWLRDIPLIFILFAMVAVYGTVAYFAVVHRSFVTIVLSLVGIPFGLAFLWLLFMVSVAPFQITASILRTRVFRKG